MKPILYKSTETVFETNGIGVLSDALTCVVKEERNGSYELVMTYPVSGIHFDHIVSRAIILAKPNEEDRPQPFRVCQITKPINGVIEINACHISYDMSGVAVSPFSATGIPQAISMVELNSVPSDHGFTITTDLTGNGTMNVDVPSSLRSLLGGSRGSLLDVYGGEYKYDRYDVSLLEHRGQDRGFEIRYGENMTDFNQEENCLNVYTDVYPYWAGGGTNVYLEEKTIRAEGTYNFTRVLPLDMSEYFDEAPDEASLRAAAKKYMTANDIGVPKISLKLSYEDFAEYKKRVALCDTVKVVFPRYNVSTSAKIVSAEYDVLAERYVSLEIGSTISGIADAIADQKEEIDAKPSKSLVEIISSKLAAAMLGAKGGAIRFLDTNGDGEPDELYIADNPDPSLAQKVWRFNYQGWATSVEGYNGPFTLGATPEDGLLANFVTAANITAGFIRNSSGSFKIDLDNGQLIVRSSKRYLASDYTSTDGIEAQKIFAGVVAPTPDQISKYDLNGDGYITDLTEVVNVGSFATDHEYLDVIWEIGITPSSSGGINSFRIVKSTSLDGATPVVTEVMSFGGGAGTIKSLISKYLFSDSVNCRSLRFKTAESEEGRLDISEPNRDGKVIRVTISKNGIVLNGATLSIDGNQVGTKKVIGYVVACTGGSSRAATCFIPYGTSGSFQAASNDWYCGFDFDGYGYASKTAGGGSVNSVTPVYNF